jgi:hypothetical protein
MSISDIAKFGGYALALGATAYGAKDIISAKANDPNAVVNRDMFAGQNLTFPEDLVADDIGRNFYIDIQFQKYQRRSIFDQPILQAQGGIQLPIPNNLRDQTGANWHQFNNENSPALGAGIEQFLKNNPNSATKGYDTGNFTGDLKAVSAAVAAGAATNATKNLLDGLAQGATAQGLQTFGLAQNPFMTMLYQSPQFKSHIFEWTLAPRNESETETLKNIILSFKSHMLPSFAPASGGILLTYPDMAIVTLYPTGYLYDFKMCVVKDLTINFAPSGPSFFRTIPAPTQVILSVTLQEIEFFMKEDILDPTGTQGGLRGQADSFSAGGGPGRSAGPGGPVIQPPPAQVTPFPDDSSAFDNLLSP